MMDQLFDMEALNNYFVVFYLLFVLRCFRKKQNNRKRKWEKLLMIFIFIARETQHWLTSIHSSIQMAYSMGRFSPDFNEESKDLFEGLISLML